MTAIEIQSYYIQWISPDKGDGKIDRDQAKEIGKKLDIPTRAVVENYHKWVSFGYGLSVIEKYMLYN